MFFSKIKSTITQHDPKGFTWHFIETKAIKHDYYSSIVGVLGTGVPRLACLRPTSWLLQRPGTAHLPQQTLKTLARGQASRGG